MTDMKYKNKLHNSKYLINDKNNSYINRPTSVCMSLKFIENLTDEIIYVNQKVHKNSVQDMTPSQWARFVSQYLFITCLSKSYPNPIVKGQWESYKKEALYIPGLFYVHNIAKNRLSKIFIQLMLQGDNFDWETLYHS
jgi:hypothetical protein